VTRKGRRAKEGRRRRKTVMIEGELDVSLVDISRMKRTYFLAITYVLLLNVYTCIHRSLLTVVLHISSGVYQRVPSLARTLFFLSFNCCGYTRFLLHLCEGLRLDRTPRENKTFLRDEKKRIESLECIVDRPSIFVSPLPNMYCSPEVV
jgi:hypothetical protein